jgi:hypothetical protein
MRCSGVWLLLAHLGRCIGHLDGIGFGDVEGSVVPLVSKEEELPVVRSCKRLSESHAQPYVTKSREDVGADANGCVIDTLPRDRQAFAYAAATAKNIAWRRKNTEIPEWANPECPGQKKQCYIEYTSCSECWHAFANMSKRFSSSNATEQGCELDMMLATFMRANKNRGSRHKREEGYAQKECDRACHLRQCFSCDHATPFMGGSKSLGILRGKQTFVDNFLVLSAENATREWQAPVHDDLVMSSSGDPTAEHVG